MRKSEDLRVLITALLVALVLASNDVTRGGFGGILLSYAYWICRILIESVIFLGFLYALEKYTPAASRRWMIYAAAIAVSLILFTLAITSFDLILGLPELGLNDGVAPSTSRLRAFELEILYLLDNHVALCVLLLMTRAFSRTPADRDVNPDAAPEDATRAAPVVHPGRTFLESLDPPLQGAVLWIEAQEHYVRITTSSESRMVLYRFSDAIRELPGSRGMQVHRSHWVAYMAVTGLRKEGQSVKLSLSNDELVPVSRSFRTKVEEQFSELSTQRS